MVAGDEKILYEEYLSYGWHPKMETYENYYREQEEGEEDCFYRRI